jgi:Type I phosphodiesterase / nucleotide pyrophosphatase
MSSPSADPAPVPDLPAPPPYGSRTLADVLPSAAAVLGVPGFTDTVGLSARVEGARRLCVLLVDGLGADLLAGHLDAAPYLRDHGDFQVLSTGFPSTTPTSLASIGTGLPPGGHGLLGFRIAVPGSEALLHPLRWDPAIDPLVVQPNPTVFERAAAAGVAVVNVAPARFDGTPLTTAAMRGARYDGSYTAGDMVARARDALRHGDRSLVYCYHGDLDMIGHVRGCTSTAWQDQLHIVDAIVETLAGALPPDAALLVTADHGMLDVPPERHRDVDADPALRDGVRLLGGENRARYLFCEPGAAADVLATWRERLGDGAWVFSREEAVATGLFGPFADGFGDRIGDVVAVARDIAIVASQAEPLDSRLIGMHGAVTPAELRIPLIVVPPR